jgi:hypothetical protein
MNTYKKYAPNVFLAKCEEEYEKGDEILVETRHGKENECIVFNLIKEEGGFFFYSIIRADGFNFQEWAKRRAERHSSVASNATRKSNEFYEASNEGRSFLSLGEPIKIGHHSETRHRNLIERNHNRMRKSVDQADRAGEYQDKAEYWEKKSTDINASMPESLEYFEFLAEKMTSRHQDIKSGKIEKRHNYSLTYAKKDANEANKKLELSKKLWA